jgi:DNA polymerase-3 subunit epsilon
MILIFDTETTGLLIKGQPTPHLVQLAAMLMDHKGRECASISLIIRPDGYEIPPKASAIHGISTAMAMDCGVPLIVACGMFSNLIKISSLQVAHNAEYDCAIILAAFQRVSRPVPTLNTACTKELASPILNLPPTEKMLAAGFNKPKSPNLAECMQFFFREEIVNAHNALIDTKCCARVYFEIMRRMTATESAGR